MGTAGSVKNAEEFLDDTFLVISGDALTDIDLGKAVEYHYSKGSMATLVLKRSTYLWNTALLLPMKTAE